MYLPILAMVVATLHGAASPDISDYVPPTPGCNFTLIYFESGSARLSARGRETLDWIVTARNKARYPSSFELDGNTDRVGTRRANLRLARRRLEAVRAHLSRSLPTPRFVMRAHGEDRPMVETEDGVAERENRMVTVLEIHAPEESARIAEWHRVNGPWRGPVC
jgi:outer membrane protein OmpA-like peptidoglycan-associated protein